MIGKRNYVNHYISKIKFKATSLNHSPIITAKGLSSLLENHLCKPGKALVLKN